MATVAWSAYSATVTAIASATLSALASGTAAADFALGPELTVDQKLYADLDLLLGSAVTTTSAANPFVGLYLLPKLSNGLYPDNNGSQSAGIPSPNHLVGTYEITPGNAVQYMTWRGIILPPGNYKFMVNNQLGVAFPTGTSANTCVMRTYTETAA